MTYRIYPKSVPEFRWVQLKSGSFLLQVRYVNAEMGYFGKWLVVPSITEDELEAEMRSKDEATKKATEEALND
jgi:hypothetical protein